MRGMNDDVARSKVKADGSDRMSTGAPFGLTSSRMISINWLFESDDADSSRWLIVERKHAFELVVSKTRSVRSALSTRQGMDEYLGRSQK